MATTASPSALRASAFRVRYVWWTVFALMAALVLFTRELTLLDPNSFLRQRYAPFAVLMFLHGIPGATALLIGPFQFSTWLRQRFTKLHRVSGRIYAGCVLISAPVAILVAINLPVPTLLSASIIQASGWILTTGTAIYCILTGRVQPHREWMMRSYPFAAVFIVARAVDMIPAIDRMGVVGLEATVWSAIALAGMLPSFVIAWQAIPPRKRAANPSAISSRG
jgi:uncharacterized membrane protein